MKINKDHATGFPQVKANVKYIFVHNAWSTESAKAVCHQDKLPAGYNNGNANYYIDDKEIWESVPAGITAWHCGVYSYNQQSIAIEICKDRVSKDVYMKAEANALKFVAELCKKYKLNPDKAIMLHHDVYNTACPATSKKYYGSYDNVKKQFKKKVRDYMNPQEETERIGWAEFMGKSRRLVKVEIMPWDLYDDKLNNLDAFAHGIWIQTAEKRNIYDANTNEIVGEFSHDSGKRYMYINTELENAMTRGTRPEPQP